MSDINEIKKMTEIIGANLVIIDENTDWRQFGSIHKDCMTTDSQDCTCP